MRILKNGGPTDPRLKKLMEEIVLQNQVAAADATQTAPNIPQFTSREEAESRQDRAANQFLFGDREQPGYSEELGQYSGAADPMSLMKFVTPAGDVEDIYSGLKQAVEGETVGEKAMGAGQVGLASLMAFAPGSLSSFKAFADFQPDDIAKPMNKILEAVASRGDAGDLIDSFAPDISKLPAESRERIAMAFDDLRSSADEAMIANQDELDKMADVSVKLRGLETESMPDDYGRMIGTFENQLDPNMMRQNYVSFWEDPETGMYMQVSKTSDNTYRMDIEAGTDNIPVSPTIAGKLILEGLDKVPVGGVVDMTSNSLSTDSYPMVMRYLARGKAKPVGKTRWGGLNAMGVEPRIFARTFNVPAEAVDIISGKMATSPQEAMELIQQFKPNIDEKLAEVGLPASRVVGSELKMPYPNFQRTQEGFNIGGRLKIRKQSPKGLRVKRLA